MTSAVLIVPAANRDEANAFGEAQGYGPNSYSVPLTPDGTTITHWGCRAEVGQSFIDQFENPSPEAEPVVAFTTASFREEDGYEHFHEFISELGLSIWTEGEVDA